MIISQPKLTCFGDLCVNKKLSYLELKGIAGDWLQIDFNISFLIPDSPS